MKKHLVLLLALVMVFGIHSGAFADDDDRFTLDGFKIDENGSMWYRSLTEIMSTNDTVTASESGKVFFVSDGGAYAHVKFALPAAAAYLNYTFIQQGTGTLIELEPVSTEQLLFSTAGTGDRLIGPATVGASIHIWASTDTVWFVETNGTFTVQLD